ncbi:TPA: GNAT family protein [Staphylococcus aureus]|uniref:GNAT family N-acetyltransferase n=1 Tax=Staphylococcus aureus TaxID=1280 RepID=UPI000ABE24B5|nr:GNAT family protein [Staphylococcus aureus]MBG1206489.1 GNAT family N-acetyltransferase [Staphylococcus aureus]MBU6867595.1 GNAT family N-acetyltransferase [Staphylococcus aureus]MBU7233511.1 GNAT family N-acetyltransferase [Staphylococcus aureus]MBU7234832.1 GNAT family N-acetyltransferase [Staphylococcus aureus]MBY0895186.1 GNAT family N-acetyltransferase [Staphylococcus aureus]
MINTERLNLMIPSSSHLIELYNICSHPQANIYTPKGLHNSKLDTQRWIEKWQNHWQQYQFGYFVLVKKIDCSVIGICGYEYRQLKQETVKVIRTNKCNQRSINLAERLKFKRDKAMDDIINQGDIVFYK